MSKIIVPDQFKQRQAEHNSIQRSAEIERFRTANKLTHVISFERSPLVIGLELVEGLSETYKVWVGRSVMDDNLMFEGTIHADKLRTWIDGFVRAFDYCDCAPEKP